MKNFKRILALVIAAIMVVGTTAGLSAAGKWYSEAVTYLENTGIATVGTKADEKITRNEFVLWVAKLETKQLDDSAWNDEIANTTFTDVTDEHHKAAIAYSERRGFIIGNGDGTFSPDKAITLAEACAVIVRLMGYENKVDDTSDEAWALNYMQVAATYCHAMDETFYKETATFNPDYELTYGEAAYLLATIMNFNKKPTDSDYSETSDGIDLGEYFDQNPNVGKVSKSYYVAKMDRVSNGLSMARLIHCGGKQVERFTNEIKKVDGDGNPVYVILVATDGSDVLEISGEEFLKLLRVSLGLAPEKTDDPANEIYEAEINAFEYVDVGSMVDVVVDKSTGDVTSFSVSGNSVIVDTYLQATSAKAGEAYGDNSVGATEASNMIISADDLSKFVGWTFREIGDTENTVPVLPLSYDAENDVTSWTNIVKNSQGVVTSAVLNFRGQKYNVGTNSDIEIMKISTKVNDDSGKEEVVQTALTADEAVKTLINVAQGECFVVFNDVDGDGRFDTAFIKESDPFLYTGTMNVQGATTNKYDYYSSVSGGEVVGNAQMKGNAIGTIFYNQKVEFAAGGTSGVADYRTDGYKLVASTTNKLQIVLRASNKHLIIDGYTTNYGSASPHFYTVADIASFNVGIIEDIDAFALDNYYIAKIKTTSGETKTVYIPISIPATTTLPITVAGAKADYTFDSSAWGIFLDQAKDELIESGIVSGVEDPAYRQATAAWMAGKYVQFVTDADNKVVFIIGTDSQVGTSGFVTGVSKTETGDNTYNVSIAKSGSGIVSEEPYYLEAALDNATNEYRLTTPYQSGTTQYLLPAVGKLNILWSIGMYNFAGGNANNIWYDYYYNGNADLVSKQTQSRDDRQMLTTPVGLINEAINSEKYNADRDNRGVAHVNAWTVDADGIVHDQTGAKVIYQYQSVGRAGISSIVTYEVRANASSMFDWENYEVYNAIFSGKLGDPNAMNDGKIAPGKDLIYVTVMQDAGSTKYLKYGDLLSWPSTNSSWTGDKYSIVSTAAIFTQSVANWTKPQDSWVDVNGEYILSIEEIAGSRVTAADGSSYTAEYKIKAGFGPYYDRTKTATGSYTYVLKFTKVVEYTSVEGSAQAIVDKTKTLMIPLYQGETGTISTQVKATTEEDFAKYTIANGYYIDDITSLVYKLVDKAEIVYKTDDAGNIIYSDVIYDWDNATVANEELNVPFSTYSVNKYATMTAFAKDRSEEGWFPGAYYVKLDGKTYTAVDTMPVVIVTPSEDGFEITTTTLASIPEEGLFVTAWNAAESYGELSAIAVLGGTTGGETPAPTPTDDNRIVYLDSSAKSIVRASEFSKSWLVVADKSAYALPTGEDIGVIYREYSTYEEAVKAASIDLSIVGGHWYKVDKNGKIVSDMTSVVYEELDGIVIDTRDYVTGTFGAGEDEVPVYSQTFFLDDDGVYKLANVQKDNGVAIGITGGNAFVPTVDVSLLAKEEVVLPSTGVDIYARPNGTFFYKNLDGKYVLVTVNADNTLTDGVEITLYNYAWAMDEAGTGSNVYTVETESADQIVYTVDGINFIDDASSSTKYTEVTLTAVAGSDKVLMTKGAEFDTSAHDMWKATSKTYTTVTVETVKVYTVGDISFIETAAGSKVYKAVTVTPIEGAAAGTPDATIVIGNEITLEDVVAVLEPAQTIETPFVKTVTVYTFDDETFFRETKAATDTTAAEYKEVTVTEYSFNGKTYAIITDGAAYTLPEDKTIDDATKADKTVIMSSETVTLYTEMLYKNADGDYKFISTASGSIAEISGAPVIAYNINDFSLVSGTALNGAYKSGETYLVSIDGKYYPADSNYRRIEVSSTVSGLKQGTITKADAAGNTYATINGVKNVNVTNYKFEFFYRNADKSVLYKAGDSTNVTIASQDTYNAQIKAEQEAYDKAVKAYEAAVDKGYLSEERLAYYKEAVEAAEEALNAKKNSLLDKYFNGRFWCVANSPYYSYVVINQGTFQQPVSNLTFYYIQVGDTYCVFSDEFVLN